MNYKYDVFLSYHSKDQDKVEKIKNALNKAGISVWQDKENILPGESVVQAIQKGLEESITFAIFVSPEAMESEWVILEYELAMHLSKGNKEYKKLRIIPVILRRTKLPGFLETLQWADFSEDSKFEDSLKKLISLIQSITAQVPHHDENLPLHEVMSNAKHSMIISGHTLDKFSKSSSFEGTLVTLLTKGINVTITLLNPYSNYAKAHEPFHILESKGSAYNQTIQSIGILKNIFEASSKPSTFEVFLTSYMPRFRTIIVDEELCHINLYMYGKDVGSTPEYFFDKNGADAESKWFETISNSLKEMIKSPHIIPLIKDGVFNENWAESKISHILSHCLESIFCNNREKCWNKVQKAILGYQNDKPERALLLKICDKNYKPGTFTLEQVSTDSKFLESPVGFDDWLDAIVKADLELIRKISPYLLQNSIDREIYDKVKLLLTQSPKGAECLKKNIWYQEYSDIIHRIIMTILAGYPDYDLNIYPNLTVDRKDFIYKVISWLERNKNPTQKDWLHLSIAAGILGIDEKTSHAATSRIDSQIGIVLNKPDEKLDDAVSRVGNEIWVVAKSKCRIDASNLFFHMLETNNTSSFNLVSFPDDYLETLFLLKYYEELIKRFKRIQIDFIPRSTRCSNDATYDDVKNFLERFPGLQNEDRFRVIENGPKIGGVNLFKLHHKVMDSIDKAFVVDVRGARNYEMMQGINKQAFFGFIVCREFSESVSGLQTQATPFIYIHHTPGDSSFEHFTLRHNRRDNSNNMLAGRTIKDKEFKWKGGHLAEFENWTEKQRNRYKLLGKYYSQNIGEIFLENEVKEFLDKISGKVLVIGCGTGKEVDYLHRKVKCDPYGIDFSSEAVIIAQNDYPELKNRFFVEDFYNIETIMDGDFDAVVANASLCHLLNREDISSMIRKISKRLKQGGLFFVRLIEKVGFASLTIDEYCDYISKFPKTKNIMERLKTVNEEKITIDTNQFLEHYKNEDFSRNGALNEILKYAKNMTEELDNHNGERWFVYFSLKELKEITKENGFEIKKEDNRKHKNHPTVSWISLLLEKTNSVPDLM
ncbi:MAG: TIR domain-containing protein [Candidatus Aminicenantes bacterium]|nr:TIR domain-containing protein [Candidatus Aminicenantes bacterium]